MGNHVDLWNKCLTIIKDNINENSFQTWFEPIIPISLTNQIFVLQVPSPFFVEFIEEKYIDILSKTLTKVVGEGTKLEYRVLVDKTNNQKTQYASQGSEANRNINYNKNTTNHSGQNRIKSPYAYIELPDIDSQLNSLQYFNNLIEGKSNKLARTAGLSIAKNPGNSAFNPFFIYGKSGVGKTHLANAIGLEILKNYPDKRVLYVSANTFQIQYSSSVINNTQNDFLNFYQTIDVLILDDVHEFSGKKGTQNVYFHIFNHLHQLGKQLILTCDRPPSQLKDIEERLLTRFKWRLVADIQQPDTEMRKKILINIIKRDGLEISEDVIDFIAENVTDNVRDLEGVISSLILRSSLLNTPLDIALVEEVIGNVSTRTHKTITVDTIKESVCEYFGLSVDDIATKSRKSEVVQARQISMYLSKQLTKDSLTSIGKKIGNRNHATVLHSCNKVEDLMFSDKHYKQDVEEIKQNLKK